MAVWHGHYTAAETLLKMGNAVVDAENEVGTVLMLILSPEYTNMSLKYLRKLVTALVAILYPI